MITQNLWTYELNNSTLAIDETFGLTALSIVLVSGTGTLLGNGGLNNGLVSTPIILAVGQPITIASPSGAVFQQLSIATTGVMNIIGFI
jgi:hypothetical protein